MTSGASRLTCRFGQGSDLGMCSTPTIATKYVVRVVLLLYPFDKMRAQ